MKELELKDLITKVLTEVKSGEFDDEIGHVISIADGIAVISGLNNAFYEEIIEFESGVKGILLILNSDNTVNALIIGDYTKIRSGEEVKRTKKNFTIKVSQALVGKILNGYGESLKKDEIIIHDKTALEMEVDAAAPGLMEIQAVDEQIITGIRTIDWLIPIGCGQKQLFVGHRFTGKSTLASDIIINCKNNEKFINIYVSIGQKKDSIVRFKQELDKQNVKNFIIVVADSSDPISMLYFAPYVGCAIGEYFRKIGKNVIVFYDTLTRHADAYRAISLLLRRPPGREAYPGDVFYLHSRLLERAANVKNQGTLTAIPIVEMNEISDYIPTNVISITDGQVVLDEKYTNLGIFPSIDIGKSVSRVGTGIQPKFLKELVGLLRQDLSLYYALLETLQFSSDITEESRILLEKGKKIQKILIQKNGYPDPYWKQIMILYSLRHNFLKSDTDIEKYAQDLNKYINFADRIENRDINFIEKCLKEILT